MLDKLIGPKVMENLTFLSLIYLWSYITRFYGIKKWIFKILRKFIYENPLKEKSK